MKRLIGIVLAAFMFIGMAAPAALAAGANLRENYWCSIASSSPSNAATGVCDGAWAAGINARNVHINTSYYYRYHDGWSSEYLDSLEVVNPERSVTFFLYCRHEDKSITPLQLAVSVWPGNYYYDANHRKICTGYDEGLYITAKDNDSGISSYFDINSVVSGYAHEYGNQYYNY